jgi:hypothetical protein
MASGSRPASRAAVRMTSSSGSAGHVRELSFSHAIDAGGSVADRSIGGPSIGGAGCVVGSAAWPVARWGAWVQTGGMPSDLISPTGMAPGSGDETLSPLRRWRNDHGEQVADCREVLSGPVVVGYDGTPEAAALVRRAAACAADARVVVVHCWRSLDNPRDTAAALRSCVHPHAVRRVLEVVREHDAAAQAAAEHALAAGVALAQEAGAEASGFA